MTSGAHEKESAAAPQVSDLPRVALRGRRGDPNGDRAFCYKCHRPELTCICASIVPVHNRTRVVILQHPLEERHSLGTVRILRLALQNIEVVVPRKNKEGKLAYTGEIPDGAAMLFPGPTARPLRSVDEAPDEVPRPLFVVDGTWCNAAKLLRDNPKLAAVRRVTIAPSRPGNYRIRKADDPRVQLSTVEAVAEALEVLEPETRHINDLRVTFDAMIDRQLTLGREAQPRYRDRAERRELRSQAAEVQD